MGPAAHCEYQSLQFIVKKKQLFFYRLLCTLCLTWLFLFCFVALVLCVKPAPELQGVDDAIGFLRDHSKVRIANYHFFLHPILILSLIIFYFPLYLYLLSLFSRAYPSLFPL